MSPLWKIPMGLLILTLLVVCSPSDLPHQEVITDETRERLSLELSELPGYFDTDNLISNETSYQHVIPLVERFCRQGEAYIGVGPDQNFTYIAHSRPSIAFIVDIRRDNLLLHLFFKELFHISETRIEFLSNWLGKPLPAAFLALEEKAPIDTLVEYFRRLPSDSAFQESLVGRLWEGMLSRSPRTLRESDREVIGDIARAFFRGNLQLKFNSHGRPPRFIYPSLGELLTESDLGGRRQSFLSNEQHYQFVRSLQQQNRIVPVIGDLGGGRTLIGIGSYLREKGQVVSLFYASNVEFYLFRQGKFRRFVQNLESLPTDQDGLLVRSYFGYWRSHPESVPGYPMVSIAQVFSRFFANQQRNPYFSFDDLAFRDYLRNEVPSSEDEVSDYGSWSR